MTRLVAGTAVGAVCLWLTFRRVPIGDIGRVLVTVHSGWVALAVGAIVAASLLRAWRWKQLFPPGDRGVSLPHVWTVLIVGQAINILVPARVGDIARLVLIERTDGRAKAETLATIGVEKLLDTATFIVMTVMLSVLVVLPDDVKLVRDSFLWVSAVLLLVGGVTIAGGERLLDVLQGLAILPDRWRRAVVDRALRPLIRGSAAVRRFPLLLSGLLLSAMAWSAAWLANYSCLVALDIRPGPVAALLVLVVLQIGTALAASPGGIGVFEYLCVLSLAVFQVPRETAAIYGVLLHVVAYLPPVVLGGVVSATGALRVRTVFGPQPGT